MNNNTLVSIYLTTKNRHQLLQRALTSCQNQTYKNIEIIIIDDGSTDKTEAVCRQKSENDSRIKYIKNMTSVGVSKARNIGIKNSSGHFITGIDDDDEMLSHRIEDFTKNYNDDISLLCTSIIERSPSGQFLSKMGKKYINYSDIKRKNLVGNQIFTTKEKLESVSGFDENMHAWVDYDLWYRLIKKWGKASKIDNHSYIVNQQHQLPRITTGDRQGLGANEFINKHKADLSDIDIKYLRVRRIINNKVKLSLLETIKHSLDLECFIRLISNYCEHRFPTILTAIKTSLQNRV